MLFLYTHLLFFYVEIFPILGTFKMTFVNSSGNKKFKSAWQKNESNEMPTDQENNEEKENTTAIQTEENSNDFNNKNNFQPAISEDQKSLSQQER